MLEKIPQSRLIFIVAFVFGTVGAVGQSLLTYKNLHDYPYKIMSFPPPEFYLSIANLGVYLAPAIAILCGLLFGTKKFWLGTIAPVVSCPLVFATVFKVASLSREWSGIVDAGRNFDDTKAADVAQEFFLTMISYSVAGLIFGGVCCFLLSRMGNERKLV